MTAGLNIWKWLLALNNENLVNIESRCTEKKFRWKFYAWENQSMLAWNPYWCQLEHCHWGDIDVTYFFCIFFTDVTGCLKSVSSIGTVTLFHIDITHACMSASKSHSFKTSYLGKEPLKIFDPKLAISLSWASWSALESSRILWSFVCKS